MIALTVEAAGTIAPAEVARVAAAIQAQVSRDFGPLWGVDAKVDAFDSLEQTPLPYWPVILTSRKLDEDEGLYISPGGGSFSVVETIPGWSIVASRIVLELLANPTGTRTMSGTDASRDLARIEYLVEVTAPCQSVGCAYLLNDVVVSDFVMPSFYLPEGAASDSEARSHSFRGHISAPLDLALGGSLTFVDRADRRVVHIRRDESGRRRSWTFYLRSAPKEPLRFCVAELISRRRKEARMFVGTKSQNGTPS